MFAAMFAAVAAVGLVAACLVVLVRGIAGLVLARGGATAAPAARRSRPVLALLVLLLGAALIMIGDLGGWELDHCPAGCGDAPTVLVADPG